MEKKSDQMEQMNDAACKTGHCGHGFVVSVVILMLLNLLATAGLAYSVYQANSTKKVEENPIEALRKMEYDRVGGKEMFDLIAQYQTLSAPQQKTQIEAAIKQLQSAATTLSSDNYAVIMKDSYVEGKKDAKVTLIEYSDLECPYCIIQFKNKTISTLQAKYGDNVNVIYKPLNLAGHPGSDQKGWASLCVAQIGGVDKYAKFYKAILDRSIAGGAVFPLDNIKSLAKEVGVDATKFASCYDSKQTETLYKSYTAEALKFGVGGTPTTMILNNSTKQYELVKGAADVSAFYPVVDRIMK